MVKREGDTWGQPGKRPPVRHRVGHTNERKVKKSWDKM